MNANFSICCKKIAKRLIGKYFFERLLQGVGIARDTQHTVDPIRNNFAGAEITVEGHYWERSHHRFDQDIRKPFEARGQYERVRFGDP